MVGAALTSLETSDTNTGELLSQVGRKTVSVGEMSQACRAYSVHCLPKVRVRTSSRCFFVGGESTQLNVNIIT